MTQRVSAQFVDEANPEAQETPLPALLSAVEFRQRLLERCPMRVLSPTVIAILQLTESSGSTAQQVAGIVRQDAGFAVKVLTLANSALYSPPEPITSLRKAVMTIGLQALRRLTLTIAVVDQIRSLQGSHDAEKLRSWEHATATALASAAIAKCQGETADRIDEAFTLGLLHDIGKVLIQLTLEADNIDSTLRRITAASSVSVAEVEKRLFGMSHGQVAAEYLQRWALSRSLITDIALHDRSNRGPNSQPLRGNLARLALAERFSRALLLGTARDNSIHTFDTLADELKLTDTDLHRLQCILPQQCSDLLQAISQQLAVSGESDAKRLKKKPVTIEWMVSPPVGDAGCMAMEQLADGQGPVNLRCVRIRESDDSRTMGHVQRQLSRAGGRNPLPVLIIMDRQCRNQPVTLAPDIPSRIVAVPMTLNELVTAVNELISKC